MINDHKISILYLYYINIFQIYKIIIFIVISIIFIIIFEIIKRSISLFYVYFMFIKYNYI